MPNNSGHEFAFEAIDHVTACAQGYCDNQERCIEATNQPEIVVLQARGSLLYARCKELRRELVEALSAVRDRKARGSRAWNLTIAIILTVAAFFFALMTFEPFHLGWKPYFYCGGLAVLGLFALDYFMTQWRHPNVARATSIVLLAVAIPTILVLAVIRGDVFAHALNEEVPVVIGDAVEQEPPPDDTAQHAALLLRWAMALAALGFEIAAGIAVHEFRKAQEEINEDAVPVIRRDLLAAEMELLAVIHRIAELQSQPAAHRAIFWRDFYRGLITNATRGAALKGLVVVVLACAALQNLRAEDNLRVVVELDLSRTEIAKGFNGPSEFNQNVRAISTMLGTLPPGSKVDLVGITGDSFATPYTLLSAQLSDDPGPFSAGLTNGRRTVVGAWTKRTQALSPSFLHTDLLGASVYAGQMFSTNAATGHKVLLFFSDMRHEAHGLDLETPKTIDVKKALAYVQAQGLFAPLAGVDVYVFGAGAHGGDKDAAYWSGLKSFWLEYFRRSGATVAWFSPGREREALIRVTAPRAGPQR